MLDLLFVYGTLRSEFDNEYAQLLRAQSERLGPAIVRGSIYRVGSYPGFRQSPEGAVAGELYRLHDPERTFALLDSYEGEEFERIAVDVQHTGTEVETWIYRFCADPGENARIESGDFSAQ